VHSQEAAEVTESPMPTTMADRGAIGIAGVAAELGFAVALAVATAAGAGGRARRPAPVRLTAADGLTSHGTPQITVVTKAVVDKRATPASHAWLTRRRNLPWSAMTTYLDADVSAVALGTSGSTSLVALSASWVPVAVFSFSHTRSPLR